MKSEQSSTSNQGPIIERRTRSRVGGCEDHVLRQPVHVVCCAPHDGIRALCGKTVYGKMRRSDTPTTCKRCAELETDEDICPDFGRCIYYEDGSCDR
jgi:hypothetical protein